MNIENELEKIERVLELIKNVKYERHYIDNCSVIIDKNDRLDYIRFIIYDTDGEDIIRCDNYEDFIVKLTQYLTIQYYDAGRHDLQRQLKELLGD